MNSLKLLALLISITLVSCSSKQLNSLDSKNLNQIKDKYSLKKFQLNIGNGKVKLIKFQKRYDNSSNLSFTCKDKQLPVFYSNKTFHSFLSESYFSKLRPYKCFLKLGKDQRVVEEFSVKVFRVNYPSERLRVNKKHIQLSKKNWIRVKKERKVLNSLYAQSSVKPLFTKKFKIPLRSKITSYYGMKRVYNNLKSSQHLGTDLRARIGTKIRSTNKGKIVLAKDLFYTGKTVIIDHGVGVFSVYGHLSKILVKEGEVLPRKALIALSGATGRVSGPHLHWGVKINENWIDGLSLIEESP